MNKQVPQQFTPKVDVFSAGIIFYILINGIQPFGGDSFDLIMKNNKKGLVNFNTQNLQSNKEAAELL